MPLLATLGLGAPVATPARSRGSLGRSGSARRGGRLPPSGGNRGGRKNHGTTGLASGDRADCGLVHRSRRRACAIHRGRTASRADGADRRRAFARSCEPRGAAQPAAGRSATGQARREMVGGEIRAAPRRSASARRSAEDRRARCRRRVASARRDGAPEDGSGKVRYRRIRDGRRGGARLGPLRRCVATARSRR